MNLTQLEKYLGKKYGVTYSGRQNGSHHQYHTPGGRVIPVSSHDGKISPRTLMYIEVLVRRRLREEQEQAS